MDNIKSIEMLHKHFIEVCGEGEKAQSERISQYTEQRKKWEKAFEWYGKNKGKPNGQVPVTGLNTYEKLPDRAEGIDSEIVAILQTFNSRGIDEAGVRDVVEGFLDKVREGWGSGLKKHQSTMG
jgi:hypothetical protein